MKNIAMILLLLVVTAAISFSQNAGYSGFKNEDRIQPWSENPGYWQYKGKPVLLLGGSKTDHIFLAEGLPEHLNEITETGGNYVRNTMSQREEKELKAHLLLPDGKYDMDRWNPEYWARFVNMLKWTSERDIIVQIEVWDRFDFSREHWDISPWNPGRNINYSYDKTGLNEEYPIHPSKDKQPFFHSIPGMPMYNQQLDIVRKYQEAFVSKMLSYSLNYGNVLYCMDNETSTPVAWGQYWIDFIKSKADEHGVMVLTTDMIDDAHKGKEAVHTPIIFKDSEHYMFADISQVNIRNFDDEHWRKLLWLMQETNKGTLRPINLTKIYGGVYAKWGTGGFEDGIERFWRSILAGSASARFHRPPFGNGLNERAKGCIKAARLLENDIKLWEIEPHMEMLKERQPNEAFLAAKPGEKYALYFTNGGSVDLDLSNHTGAFRLKWISITEGRIPEPTGKFTENTIQGGSIITITAPYKGGWVASILKE